MRAIMAHDKGYIAPHEAKIIKIRELTDTTKLFELKFVEEHLNPLFQNNPGQFVELSVYGIGEVPISITSPPTKRGSFELGIRNVGNVTNAMHKLKKGDIVGIRGPFGNHFPVEEYKGKDLLFVTGGLGYLPLRSAFRFALHNRDDYGKIYILYGDRCPADVLFPEENEEYEKREDIEFLSTVDRDDEMCWGGNVGVVTSLFPSIAEKLDPKNTVAMICGPPIMYKFVNIELEKLGLDSDHIFLSLERKMKCGVGKCCHCGIGDKFVCLDGPVFTLRQIRTLPEALM
ncbi:MAG: FAD/NAD(P)-binding protein [Candidatus Heimdallarchaeota archaeon]